jgi:hypothetical protein
MSNITAEPGVIADGWKLYEAAAASVYTSDAETAQLIFDLREALELHHDLHREVIHPGRVWPDLEHEDEALDIALRRAAEDVKAESEALLAAAPSLAVQDGPVAA